MQSHQIQSQKDNTMKNTIILHIAAAMLPLMAMLSGCSTKEPVQTPVISPEALTVEKGESYTLELLPEGQEPSWSSSDNAVATVSRDGTVTGVSCGTCTVTASTSAGEASCTVTVVNVAVKLVSLNKTSTVIVIGGSELLTATVLPENADDRTVTWSSSDPEVASVENGKVSALSLGEAVITASAGNLRAECAVKVKGPDVESVTLDQEELLIKKGQTAVLTATVTPADADFGGLIWESSDESVVTVDNGNITAVEVGSAVVKVTAANKTARCTVYVSDAETESITVSPKELTLKIGESAVIEATIYPEGSNIVYWSSFDDRVATVDDMGTVTAVAEGETSIMAKAGDKFATCKITVRGVSGQTSAGDYLYSDGTTSGNLDESKTVIGIVFWTGDPTEFDKTLAADHPECTNGLAVSLTEGGPTTWQSGYLACGSSVSAWLASHGFSYLPSECGNSGAEPDYLNKIMGYNNTRGIEEFNNDPANSAWKVEAVSFIEQQRNNVPAPASTSGWYLPSAKEISLLCSGEIGMNLWDFLNVNTSMRDLVNSRMSEIEGATPLFNGGYWSSTELDAEKTYYCFYTNGVFDVDTKENKTRRTRAVLAF